MGYDEEYIKKVDKIWDFVVVDYNPAQGFRRSQTFWGFSCSHMGSLAAK